MFVTGHKSLQSLSMYQRVKADEKMMMGMSLAYSLVNPIEVQSALQEIPNFDVDEPVPFPLPAMAVQDEKEETFRQAEGTDPTLQNFLPVEKALQPYVKNKNQKESDFNFDLMEIITEVNDEELMLAATQIETEYEKGMTTSKTAVIKKSGNATEMAASPFANCRIGSIGTININIYKQ